MTQIILVRHAQASFGADDYDVLSDLGHEQARVLGQSLAAQRGSAPTSVYLGGQRRHTETLRGLAPALDLDADAGIRHEGLNEFDSKALLRARFGPGGLSQEVRQDRKHYFRTLRETVLAWQRDEIDDPPESWAAFTDRVASAREAMLAEGGTVLAVSSGGAISCMIAGVLGAPASQMILMQLQMKNCAVSRLVGGARSVLLHSFNEAPHLWTTESERLLTYA